MKKLILKSALFLLSLPMLSPDSYAQIGGRIERMPPTLTETIYALSDADMVSTAYFDAMLENSTIENTRVDSLNIFTSAGSEFGETQTTIELPNSVGGPPTPLEISSDSRWMFVVETYEQRKESDTTFFDLGIGKTLFVVDLETNTISSSIELNGQPDSVRINPQDDMIAVGMRTLNNEKVALIPFDNGALGEPTYHQVPGLDPAELAILEPSDWLMSNPEWHPSGEYLAITVNLASSIVFAKVITDQEPVLELIGEPITVDSIGRFPMNGTFTSTGNHYITNIMNWGADIPGFWVFAPQGSIASISFNENAVAGDPQQRHFISSVVSTETHPEGFALSAQDDLIVTGNQNNSYFGADNELITGSSISLIAFDDVRGELNWIEDYPYESSVLPQGIDFDSTGKFLVTTSFENRSAEGTPGEINFWRVVRQKSGEPSLRQMRHFLPVVRGLHTIKIQ